MRLPAAAAPKTMRALAGLFLCASAGCTANFAQVVEAGWRHEVRDTQARDPLSLPAAPIPTVPPPVTVADDSPAAEPFNLSLNDAVRITLENAKAIRVFNGLSASNSGRSIYDAAIATTAIDQAQARFDPTLTASQTNARSETPRLGVSQVPPFKPEIVGPRVDTFRTAVGLSRLNPTGGTTAFNLTNDRTSQDNPSGLNPFNARAGELSYTQPLLQGGGFLFNIAPIVIARIDTERSYFQFKDATQELVRGTVEAYWNLVFSRLAVWAAEIQFEQSTEGFKREEARQQAGIGDIRNVAQAKVTLNQFKAALVAAKADVLAREGALRNVLGLPASDGRRIVPVSAPANSRFKPEWEKLLRFAEQRRPDVIELKLVLEADGQRRLQAENAALPRLDATGSYRWNGLSGRVPPENHRVASESTGQYTDWSLGVNFSVPLGLREGRARVREQDLIILRDKANLDQQLHFAAHDLAVTVRGLENSYEQYLAYRETRAAALTNLLVQIEEQRAGRGIYLSVLQALNDWGNAITSEARALVNYNVLLATLERQTGTILETHGLVFLEERFTAAGPLVKCAPARDYPQALKPVGEPTKYPSSDAPGENAFGLTKPVVRPPKAKFAEDGDK